MAVIAPEWLLRISTPEWFQRYGRRVEHSNLPKSEAERAQLSIAIAADGEKLLQAVESSSMRDELSKLEDLTTLRRVWEEQFEHVNGQLRSREVKAMPSPATLIASP